MGYILLEGGAEFVGRMAEPDLKALELAGGVDALVCIIPTAAAPDHNHGRAGGNGVRWFEQLGARNVELLPLIDGDSADLPSMADRLKEARLVYMLGGFPRYLCETLAGSRSWQAMGEAYDSGAVIGGSSAGAMVMCEHYFDPFGNRLESGLGLIGNACVIPHYDTFGKKWVDRLTGLLPQALLIGIDEQTGAIGSLEGGSWQVYGKSAVTLHRKGEALVYLAGEIFLL